MFSQTESPQFKMMGAVSQNNDKSQDVTTGKWSNEENLKYAIFMDFHKVTLSSRQKKKNFRVFQQMALFIGTRNTVQCRSHHQKLQERFKHFKKIISAVKNQVGRKEYKYQYKKWTDSGSRLIRSQPLKSQDLFLSEKQAKQAKQVVKSQAQFIQNKAEQKGLQMPFTPTIMPFFPYNSFANNLVYGIPNYYNFGNQFFC